jgi:serine/threonine protein kinase
MNVEHSQHYRLVRPAGALFQADLFLGESVGVDDFTKHVTVWKIRPELVVHEDAVEYLLADLKMAATLSTSTVTQVLDVWRSGDELSVAVEHVDGKSLLKLMLDVEDTLPFETTLKVIIGAARALEIAHETQPSRDAVVHGDLRPENLLVSDDGAVKLTGFGFGRFLSALPPRGLFCSWDGWCYQPAERLDVAELDPRSDIFSLGLVLYQAITGKRPYGTDDQAELVELLERRKAPLGSKLRTGRGVAEVLRKACAPSIDDRYQTAEAFAADLDALLTSGQVPTASPVLVREQLGTSVETMDLIDLDEESALSAARTSTFRRPPRADTIKQSEFSLNESDADAEASLSLCQKKLERARSGETLTKRTELRLVMELARAALRAARFDVAEPTLHEALALAEESDDAKLDAEILLLQIYAKQGKLKVAMERAKDTIPRAEGTGDPLLLSRAYGAIGEAYQQFGHFGPDLRYIEAAVSFAVESNDAVELGKVLRLAVTHAAGVGEAEQTRLLLDQIRPIAEESDDPLLQGQLLNSETMLNLCTGDFDAALSKALKGVLLARKHGFLQLEVELLHNAGEATFRQGRARKALDYFKDSLDRSRAGHYDRLTEVNIMYIGFIEATELALQQGLDRLRSAIDAGREHGRIVNLQRGHELLGRALLSMGDRAGALDHLREALRFAKNSGVKQRIEESNRWLNRASDDDKSSKG